MGRKKKKDIPNIDEQNLYQAFGVEEGTPVFSEELENNLVHHDLEKIIREKSAAFRKPVSKQDKLKKYPPPQDQIDLHGLTGVEAERKVVDFLKVAKTLKCKTLRVITGKGLHSNGPAVLPDIIEAKLDDLRASELIFDFQWEKKDKLKSGAVIVYLN